MFDHPLYVFCIAARKLSEKAVQENLADTFSLTPSRSKLQGCDPSCQLQSFPVNEWKASFTAVTLWKDLCGNVNNSESTRLQQKQIKLVYFNKIRGTFS